MKGTALGQAALMPSGCARRDFGMLGKFPPGKFPPGKAPALEPGRAGITSRRDWNPLDVALGIKPAESPVRWRNAIQSRSNAKPGNSASSPPGAAATARIPGMEKAGEVEFQEEFLESLGLPGKPVPVQRGFRTPISIPVVPWFCQGAGIASISLIPILPWFIPQIQSKLSHLFLVYSPNPKETFPSLLFLKSKEHIPIFSSFIPQIQRNLSQSPAGSGLGCSGIGCRTQRGRKSPGQKFSLEKVKWKLCSEVFLGEAEAEAAAVPVDDLGQPRGAAEEHLDLPAPLRRHLPEHLEWDPGLGASGSSIPLPPRPFHHSVIPFHQPTIPGLDQTVGMR